MKPVQYCTGFIFCTFSAIMMAKFAKVMHICTFWVLVPSHAHYSSWIVNMDDAMSISYLSFNHAQIPMFAA